MFSFKTDQWNAIKRRIFCTMLEIVHCPRVSVPNLGCTRVKILRRLGQSQPSSRFLLLGYRSLGPLSTTPILEDEFLKDIGTLVFLKIFFYSALPEKTAWKMSERYNLCGKDH